MRQDILDTDAGAEPRPHHPGELLDARRQVAVGRPALPNRDDIWPDRVAAIDHQINCAAGDVQAPVSVFDQVVSRPLM